MLVPERVNNGGYELFCCPQGGGMRQEPCARRSPSSALLPFFFFGWEGSPTKTRKKVGTLF